MISEIALRRFQDVFGYAATWAADSPGRTELIGNHTDYNAGLVIGITIDRRLAVAAAVRSDGQLRLNSLQFGQVGPKSGADLLENGPEWTRYVAGTHQLLQEQSAASLGFDMTVVSDIPEGAGLSSSAALEVASALVMQPAFGLDLSSQALAELAQAAENKHVGVPCGILDHATVVHGGLSQAVLVDAAAARIEPIPIPSGFRLFVFVPTTRHRLADGQYAKRRAECEVAWEALRDRCPEARGLAECDWEIISEMSPSLPPDVVRRAQHVIQEHERVKDAVGALAGGNFNRLGQLLNESFASSQELFENSSPEQDALVAALQDTAGVRGARLTGGGFGGSVIALVGPGFTEEHARAVCAAVGRSPGVETEFYSCSPGPSAGLRYPSVNKQRA